jgi:ABC-type branched-subunit amino acid transport system substrate-binding protein
MRKTFFAGSKLAGAIAFSGFVVFANAALAANAPGVTATEIRIGQTAPYSGPVSAYSVYAKVAAAYFQMINEQGGINGRKLVLESVDDGYNPAKTIQQTRKLIEEDHVAFIFASLGTPTALAVRGYLNDHKIPQLFIGTGVDRLSDPAHFPWTLPFNPSYRVEARIYAKYLLKEKPAAKLGVLYQSDDLGRDYLRGMKDVLGDRYGAIVVKEEGYEPTDPTVKNQIISLRGAGADAVLVAATARFAAQAIRDIAGLGWHPLRLLSGTSISIESVLKPAGLSNADGAIGLSAFKDVGSPQWTNDQDLATWRAFMNKYIPGASTEDSNSLYGYIVAQTIVHVLKQCGDDLSHENILKQATNLKKFAAGGLLPGVTLNTSPTNYHPISQLQLMRFDGREWTSFGSVISAE